MSMSKKDFEAIAQVVLRHDAHAENNGRPLHFGNPEQARVGRIARDLCRVFANANPRFDRDRFLRAALTVSNPFHPDNC